MMKPCTIIAFPAVIIALLPEIGFSQSGFMNDLHSGVDTSKVNDISVGMNNFARARANAYLRPLQTEEKKFSIGLYYGSASENRDYNQFDGDTDMKFSEVGGDLDYNFTNERCDFNIGLGYGYSDFNYYGYGAFPLSKSDLDGVIPKNQQYLLQEGDKLSTYRNSGAFNMGLALKFRYLNLRAGFDESYLDDYLTEAKELAGTYMAGLDLKFTDSHLLSLDATVRDMLYDKDMLMGFNGTGGSTYEDYIDSEVVRFNLQYKYHSENLKLAAGVGVDVENEREVDDIIYPMLNIDWNVNSRLHLYADLKAGLDSYSFYDQLSVNRYFMMGSMQTTQRTKTDLRMGLSLKSEKGWNVGVYAGMKDADKYRSQASVMTSYIAVLNAESVSLLSRGGYNMTASLYSDALNTYLGAEFNYEDEKWLIRETMEYNEWDCREARSGNDAFRSNLQLTYKLNSRLNLSAFYNLYAGRKSVVFAQLALVTLTPVDSMWGEHYDQEEDDYALLQSKTLSPINEVNVKADYNLNKNFGIYLGINNVLNHSFDLIYAMPSQKLSVMAGLSLRF